MDKVCSVQGNFWEEYDYMSSWDFHYIKIPDIFLEHYVYILFDI